jgi:hypothetical protein
VAGAREKKGWWVHFFLAKRAECLRAFSMFDSAQMSAASQQMANMNPDQMRQQASQMRSMRPAQLRSMNPQMAGMSDAQIEQAIQQMEMMAENPAMMQMAANQMKNMSPAQMEQMRKMQMGGAGGGAPALAPSSGVAAAEQIKTAGNDWFKKGCYTLAVAQYQRSLSYAETKLKGKDAQKLHDACHLNIAACQLKIGKYSTAARECSDVLNNGKSWKAFFRRAQARMSLAKSMTGEGGCEDDPPTEVVDGQQLLDQAESDLKEALKMGQGDEQVQNALSDLSRMRTGDWANCSSISGSGSCSSGQKGKEQEACTAAKQFQSNPSSFSIKQLRLLLDASGVDQKGAVDKAELVSLLTSAGLQPEQAGAILCDAYKSTSSSGGAGSGGGKGAGGGGSGGGSLDGVLPQMDEAQLKAASQQMQVRIIHTIHTQYTHNTRHWVRDQLSCLILIHTVVEPVGRDQH